MRTQHICILAITILTGMELVLDRGALIYGIGIGLIVLIALLDLWRCRSPIRIPSARALAQVKSGQIEDDAITTSHLSQEVLDLISGGAGAANKETIVQAGHGFAPGDVIHYGSGGYTKAQANTIANADVIGVVESVNGDEFTVVYSGRIVVSGASWTANTLYFLSATTAGALTGTEPGSGNISKPVLHATGSTSGIVLMYYGYEV